MDKPAADILEKVKKLIALGSSPSEAEAASALEKARVLLARYGLSLSDVNTSSPEITQNVLFQKKRLRVWESDLISVICKCTFTQAIHVVNSSNAHILIIGRQLNTLAAADLFNYLHLVVLKLGRHHSSDVVHLESFRRGVVHRIGERLYDMTSSNEDGGPWVGDNKTGSSDSYDDSDGGIENKSDKQLTIQMERNTSKENKDYIEEKFGKTTGKRVKSTVNESSYNKGRQAGDTVSLNRQVNN